MERKFIVRVNSNKERMSCSFASVHQSEIGTSRSGETGLKVQLEGDVMYGEGRGLETGEQHLYEEITDSLQTDAAIQNLQTNIAYEIVGLKKSVQNLELKENVAYGELKAMFDLEENVAYQGTSRQQHKR